MMAATRPEVLRLYRKIFRLARKWKSSSGLEEKTIEERQYIVDEARKLFQKNKNITNMETIHQCIEECHARTEIALHYGIPYPRPTHLPPMGLTGAHSKVLRTQETMRKQAKPLYLKSYDEI
ncbi:LYR motif-containing protein 1 isoform X2 [Hyla sarda]|nr:LYR motif-containing protein 1 isoform X2 [Hyla sarda]XP_056391421.1 LYR motif-containing protein 1 isoform X2 [Hyla sarda]XP_056391423.1 LYR motif-containing protein 1 isoform X2 [Hyla sarda]